MQILSPGLDKSISFKNGKLPSAESINKNITEISNNTNKESSVTFNQTSIVDNLTESESLEQDGVLVVNISSDNILNFDELYPNIQIFNSSSKTDEVTNKIQSNSREISGDVNKNLSKFKDVYENITVAPAPTNGVLSLDHYGEDEKRDVLSRNFDNLENRNIELNILSKPTESLQSLGDEKARRRRRRRRHGNRRRYEFSRFYMFYIGRPS